MHLRILPKGDSLLLKIALLAFVVCTVLLFIQLSTQTQVETSSAGGNLTEGIVGTPRFVNPVLAVTRADKDITALVYDGLMRLGKDGVLEPNIAESVTISEDGLTYNVVLRKDIYFHDGTGLKTTDVLFTVGRIQDPSFNSPLRTNFDGVAVEELGEYELNFVLPEPYSPFLENLTFGILPQSVWKDATSEEFPFSQHNSEPIGSGPYKIRTIDRNTSGIPESYVLEPFAEYHNGMPLIETLTLKFYSNEEKLLDAFKNGQVDSMAGIDQRHLGGLSLNDRHEVIRVPLPRTFAIFFNQNKSEVLRDESVRRALDASIDREALVASILNGYGNPLSSPIPPGFGVESEASTTTETSSGFDRAREILREGGWEPNDETGIWEKEVDDIALPLSFSIATANNAVFESTAEFLRTEWEKLGASVTVRQFEQSDLTQAVIRPRDYEALLFGTELGRALDFYPFWHSSQRNDPGLNVALYANITTDSILSDIRTDTGDIDKEESLLKFASEIESEVPTLFLYAPELLYVLPNRVVGESFTGLHEPSERFAMIEDWYIDTESIWPLFEEGEPE